MAKPQHSRFHTIPMQCTFPNYCHSPTEFEQLFPNSMVPFHISPEFCLPKVRSSSRIGCIGAASMTVPEAPVHETYGVKPTKDQVRCSGEFPVVYSISEAACMELSAKYQFRFRVFRSDSCHHARTRGCINCVDQNSACSECGSRYCRHILQDNIVAIKECSYISQLPELGKLLLSGIYNIVHLGIFKVQCKVTILKENYSASGFQFPKDFCSMSQSSSVPISGQP